MTRVLVLRPESAAGRTVERARSLGLEAIAVPLFEIEPVTWQVPEAASYDGVLLTSASALRCGGDELQQLRGLKAYAVGSATADAARGAGFDVAATGDAGVDRLLGSIDPDLRLLHLCGEDRRSPTEPRQRIDALPVYRARPLDTPDLGQTSDAVALIHSPRAGRRFRELVSDRGSVSIAAISSAAAEACGSGWRTVEIAEQPNDEALLALAARLCNNYGQR